MVERQARYLEVRGSNPGPGSNFFLEFKNIYEDIANIYKEFLS